MVTTNVATPRTALTSVAPPSVVPEVAGPSVTLTVPVKLSTTRPDSSRALTCTAGLMGWPAAVTCGCTVKKSWVGAAGAVTSRRQVPKNTSNAARAAALRRVGTTAADGAEGMAIAVTGWGGGTFHAPVFTRHVRPSCSETLTRNG